MVYLNQVALANHCDICLSFGQEWGLIGGIEMYDWNCHNFKVHWIINLVILLDQGMDLDLPLL